MAQPPEHTSESVFSLGQMGSITECPERSLSDTFIRFARHIQFLPGSAKNFAERDLN
jgi:hypothetical protein